MLFSLLCTKMFYLDFGYSEKWRKVKIRSIRVWFQLFHSLPVKCCCTCSEN